jgi:hypothetical protein
MELPGEVYLFNLSILAITFSAVSALVMLLRQTMGGRLSNFDLHLITAYVSGGFVVALNAILPPLLSLAEPSPAALWGVASGLAAAFLTLFVVGLIKKRRHASNAFPPTMVVIDWICQGIVILSLIANALVPTVQGVLLFAAALTSSLAIVMWSFVRRIGSLLGEKPGEDWDPGRG